MAAPWILGDAIMRQGFAHSWPSHIGSTGPPILAGRILPGKLTFVTDSSAALKETPFLKFASPTCLFRDPDPSKTAMQFRWTSRPKLRSEEHTSELQSRSDLVCRLLLEKKKGLAHALILYLPATRVF